MSPVKGKRWKALDRYDYDLCDRCHGALPELEGLGYDQPDLEPHHQDRKSHWLVGRVQGPSTGGHPELPDPALAPAFGAGVPPDGRCMMSVGFLPADALWEDMPAGLEGALIGYIQNVYEEEVH